MSADASLPFTYARVKHMRREPTAAELRLWGALRDRRLGGLKFYQQKPIGPYIVDFINQEHRVIVEVDGATHSDDIAVAHDERRTAFLAAQDFIVHRVDNLVIFQNLGDVLDGIYAVGMERAAK